MATRSTEVSPTSLVQFAMEEHWYFSEAAFSIARSISKIKRFQRDFAPFSDCLNQAKKLMFEESMKEMDQLLSQGRLTGYDVTNKDGINRSVHYTTRRFGKESLMKLYGISELPILHNSSRLTLLIIREAHSRADSTSHRKSPSDIIGRA